MTWPRGKNNLRKIGGFGVNVDLNLFDWRLAISWRGGFLGLHIGLIHVYLLPAYEESRNEMMYELRSERK